MRIGREPVEPLLLHAAAPAALAAAHLDVEIDTQIAACEVAHPTHGSVEPGTACAATGAADRVALAAGEANDPRPRIAEYSNDRAARREAREPVGVTPLAFPRTWRRQA